MATAKGKSINHVSANRGITIYQVVKCWPSFPQPPVIFRLSYFRNTVKTYRGFCENREPWQHRHNVWYKINSISYLQTLFS